MWEADCQAPWQGLQQHHVQVETPQAGDLQAGSYRRLSQVLRIRPGPEGVGLAPHVTEGDTEAWPSEGIRAHLEAGGLHRALSTSLASGSSSWAQGTGHRELLNEHTGEGMSQHSERDGCEFCRRRPPGLRACLWGSRRFTDT